MHKKKRSVLYAGGMQFCFPGGIGRCYLGDWGLGILQFLTSFLLVGFIWSWIDGYLMVTRQLRVKRTGVTLVHHEIISDEDKLTHTKSPIIASVLQLFCFGLGRIYWGHWLIGIGQLFFTLIFFGFFPIRYVIFRLIIDMWAILDSYCIFRGWEINPDRSPLNYSVAISSPKVNIVSKDRLIAGMLQLFCPGLGRCYLGYWLVGILQFLTSFLFIGLVWSWVDGHHILLNPGVDKDGNGKFLTDLYRLN